MGTGRFQYRLSTLLLAVTLVAIGTFLWRQFIIPYISGISIEGEYLRLHLNTEHARKVFADKAHVDPSLVIIHDSYFSFSMRFVIEMLTLAIGGLALSIAMIRFYRRPKRNGACDHSAP